MRWVLVLASLCASAGCGGDETASPPAGPSETQDAWSEPDRNAPHSAADLLARVRAQVLEGRALAGPAWQRDVESLADLLWPPVAGRPAPEVRVHMQLLTIAGDAGRAFQRDPQARSRWRDEHPLDFRIHRAFEDVSAKGPEPYKAWVATAGGRLMAEKADAMQRLFERK